MNKYDFKININDNNTYTIEILEKDKNNVVLSIKSLTNISLEEAQFLHNILQNLIWKIYNENI